MALVLLALALVRLAEVVGRSGLRVPRILPLSTGSRGEVVSLLASLIGAVG